MKKGNDLPEKIMDKWIELNTVAWRKILQRSVLSGDKDREAYARKILMDIDPIYRASHSE